MYYEALARCSRLNTFARIRTRLFPFGVSLRQPKVRPLLQLPAQVTRFRVAAELLLMTHGRRRAPYGAL